MTSGPIDGFTGLGLGRAATTDATAATGATRADAAVPSLSLPIGVLLAALSASAAVIHLAMVPAHAGASALEAVGFVAAGWAQLGLAAALIWRPRRGVLALALVANVAFLAVYVVSRRYGLPVGEHAGVAEEAGFVDLACAGLEAALVVVAAGALVFRGIGRHLAPPVLVMGSLLPLGALVLASVAIASPSAAGHGHGTDNGLAALDGGHDHGTAAASPEDLGLSGMRNGQTDHDHAATPDVPLDAATQATLDGQLAQTKVLVEQYPTIAEAEAAGYKRGGPFAPGLGAHYTAVGAGFGLNVDGRMDPEDIARPILIYDGTAPDSKLSGFMYLAQTETEPEGFAGPNDHWHYHTNVCMVAGDDGIDTPFGADLAIDKPLCDSVGGTLLANTGYMVHVWTVPGYESPRGVFSDVNPKVTCPDGTYFTVPIAELGDRNTACRD